MSLFSHSGDFADNTEVLTDYIPVSNYMKLSFCIRSDIPLQISLEWNIITADEFYSQTIKYTPDKWKVDVFKVLMPFLRLRITRGSCGKGGTMSINIYPLGINTASFRVKSLEDPTPVEVKSLVPVASTEIRSTKSVPMTPPSILLPGPEPVFHTTAACFKSPFKRRERDKTAISNPIKPMLDYRLPQFIPYGALLVGGKSGQIEFIPRGQAGEVLIAGDSGPIWQRVSPPPLPPLPASASSKVDASSSPPSYAKLTYSSVLPDPLLQ